MRRRLPGWPVVLILAAWTDAAQSVLMFLWRVIVRIDPATRLPARDLPF